MTLKLTEAQVKALRAYRWYDDVHGGAAVPKSIGVRMDVASRLFDMGLLGYGWWQLCIITPAGRAALAAIDGVQP